ncbi:IS66 family insertion sequence element accessory protein TnpA [Persicobacter psychrovividus]|uniref:Transposase n=1 Tax=Persicobacter psychrovividus TaxID=387638 RepID=A0ABM7VKM8_9BACT|nr:hypothetical protein PEPS_38220 [Persicobacter psychrovividus]
MKRGEKQKIALVEKWECSSLSIRKFCESEDISQASFYKWKRLKKEKASSSSQFHSLEVDWSSEQKEKVTQGEIEIHFPNGVKIFMPADSSMERLTDIIHSC